jgi:hypothetical protein
MFAPDGHSLSRLDQGQESGQPGDAAGARGDVVNHRQQVIRGSEMSAFRRPLDLGLAALFVASALLILVAHEDPLVRDWLCANAPCPELPHAKYWLKIIYDLAVASAVSLIFYGLVVRLPDYQRRQRLKRSFAGRYRMFKEECIGIMLSVADGSYDSALPETLVDQGRFRAYFKESVSPSQERWHAFLNNLNERNLRELTTQLDIFRDEIIFVLGSTDIPEEEPFEFLKRLSAAIRSMRDTTLDYDEAKPFARFLWEVFAGWNPITGYREGDIITRMIKSI